MIPQLKDVCTKLVDTTSYEWIFLSNTISVLLPYIYTENCSNAMFWHVFMPPLTFQTTGEKKHSVKPTRPLHSPSYYVVIMCILHVQKCT